MPHTDCEPFRQPDNSYEVKVGKGKWRRRMVRIEQWMQSVFETALPDPELPWSPMSQPPKSPRQLQFEGSLAASDDLYWSLDGIMDLANEVLHCSQPSNLSEDDEKSTNLYGKGNPNICDSGSSENEIESSGETVYDSQYWRRMQNSFWHTELWIHAVSQVEQQGQGVQRPMSKYFPRSPRQVIFETREEITDHISMAQFFESHSVCPSYLVRHVTREPCGVELSEENLQRFTKDYGLPRFTRSCPASVQHVRDLQELTPRPGLQSQKAPMPTPLPATDIDDKTMHALHDSLSNLIDQSDSDAASNTGEHDAVPIAHEKDGVPWTSKTIWRDGYSLKIKSTAHGLKDLSLNKPRGGGFEHPVSKVSSPKNYFGYCHSRQGFPESYIRSSSPHFGPIMQPSSVQNSDPDPDPDPVVTSDIQLVTRRNLSLPPLRSPTLHPLVEASIRAQNQHLVTQCGNLLYWEEHAKKMLINASPEMSPLEGVLPLTEPFPEYHESLCDNANHSHPLDQCKWYRRCSSPEHSSHLKFGDPFTELSKSTSLLYDPRPGDRERHRPRPPKSFSRKKAQDLTRWKGQELEYDGDISGE